MNSFFSLSCNSECAKSRRVHHFIACFVGISYFPEHYRFYGTRNELRNYSLVTQQRKFFICSFEEVCSWRCKTRGI